MRAKKTGRFSDKVNGSETYQGRQNTLGILLVVRWFQHTLFLLSPFLLESVSC